MLAEWAGNTERLRRDEKTEHPARFLIEVRKMIMLKTSGQFKKRWVCTFFGYKKMRFPRPIFAAAFRVRCR
jgi:hypothetical protein